MTRWDFVYCSLCSAFTPEFQRRRCLFGIRLKPLPLLPDDAILLWLHEGIVVRALDIVGLLLALGADPVMCRIGDVTEFASMILDNGAIGLRVDVLAVVGARKSYQDAQEQAAEDRGCKKLARN